MSGTSIIAQISMSLSNISSFKYNVISSFWNPKLTPLQLRIEKILSRLKIRQIIQGIKGYVQ